MKKKNFKIYLLILCLILSLLPVSMSSPLTANAANLDRTSYYNKNYTKTGNPVNDMIAIARAQLGRNYCSAYGAAWCAYFVSDVARLAGCSGAIPGDGWCATLKNNIIKAGGKEVSSAQAGDIVFYYCPSCNGDACGGPWVHVGLMVDSRNSIEGNYDGKVSSVSGEYRHHNRQHSVSNGMVRRVFVRPAYGSGPIPPPFTQDPKYDAVKGFKGYALSTGKTELLEANLSTRIGYIYAADECTVHELYTNGWCKVTCPWSDGGTRTGYTKISNFIQSPSAALGSYTATTYINLYNRPNLSIHIYRIYPNDVCRTIGTSGSATQVFMPMSDKGYYELGWAQLPGPPGPTPTIDTRYPTPFKCRILANSNDVVCAYRAVNNASTYLGHVYVNDDCMIQEVYTNGWCKFTCPFFGKTETVYGKFSDFSSCNISPYSLSAPKYAKTYYKSDKAKEVGWVDPGDAVTVIATSGSMSQIIYPADVGKRCGWIDSSALVVQYTVKYDANGGTGTPPAAQSANKGTAITLSSTTLTRPGYTFAGWTDAKGWELYLSNTQYFGNADITLYAVWRKNEYTIKYDANGGEEAPKEQTQAYGDAVTAAASLCSMQQGILVENGIAESGQQDGVSLERKFLSWNTKADGSGITVKAGEKYTPNADITLYAQYGKASFTSSTLPNAPERTGYTFEGWYDSQSYKNKIEAGQELDTALSSIHAKWKANSYPVSYDANGGSGAPGNQTKVFGETLKLSETKPARTGYTFKGWALTAKSREVVYESGSEYKENAAVTLYAVWDEVQSDLASIAIAQEPSKKTYEFGEALDTVGLKLSLTYSSGKTEEVSSGYTVTGYDSRQAGKQTLTVAYGGKTATFEVTVKAQPNEEIAVVSIDDVVGAAPGEQVEVNVQLTKNPGFSFMMLKLTYDTDALELVEAVNKTPDNNLFMMNDVIMWDSAKDVAVGSTTREPMGSVTFCIKPDIALEDGAARCEVGIESVTCYNEKEQEVTVRANKGTISVDTVNYGDVNRDGVIDKKDVQAIREYMITGEQKEDFDVQAADANGDGAIDGRDVIRLNQYIEDPTVKLGYDKNKVIGSSGENLFADDVKLSLKNISEIKDNLVTMDVMLDENPGIAALSLCADYDAEHMELIQVANGTVVDGTVAQDPEEKGILTWTTDTAAAGTGTLATLTFQLADGTDAGDYPVSVYVSSCYDSAEKSHYGASETGYVAVPMKAVAVEGITLGETALTMEGGSVAELEANVMPLDAADKTVTWSSSNEAVAVVSGNGQIHALKKGAAVITATVSNASEKAFQASCTVTVTADAPVLNIPLEEDPDRKGDSSNGQQPDTDKPNTDKPNTDKPGADKPDKDTDKTDTDKTDNVTYRLSTETGAAKIAAGKKIKMVVTGSDGSTLNNKKLTWKSGNQKVATVNSKGVVTLKKNSGGKKAAITATMKDGSGRQLKLTVRSMKGAVKSIQITGRKTVKPGKSLQLKATVKTTKGTANKKLQWSSNNMKLAKVSSSGKVKTFEGKKGTVKITAKATDGTGKKKTITIRIK